MAKAKKKAVLSLEERLEQALIPVDEQPYEVPENWCWVKFDSLSIDMSDGPFGSNLKTEHYTENKEVRIIQLSNIGEEGWREENTKYTTFEHVKTISRSIVEPGNIVIAKMMPAGRAIICPDNEKMYVLSSDAVKMVPHVQLDVNYLVYCINSQMFRNQVQENTQGITRARTSIKKLKEYAFPLPPLAEQQRIVEQIESLFAKLDEAKEKVQVVADGYEDRIRAIYNAAFKGSYTASWRTQKGITMDETWERVISQDVCEPITCGKTPKEHITDSGEIPYLKVYNIVDNQIDFLKTPQYIPRDIHEGKLKSSMLKSGDVIMNIVGPPLRKVAIIPEDYPEWNMNQAIVRFRPKKDKMLSKYLYYALLNPETLEEVISQTRGVVGQANISVSQSRNLELPCPSLEEQQEIVKILDSLLYKEKAVLEKVNNIIERIDAMKKSILADAFRGRLGTNISSEESSVNLLREILSEEA